MLKLIGRHEEVRDEPFCSLVVRDKPFCSLVVDTSVIGGNRPLGAAVGTNAFSFSVRPRSSTAFCWICSARFSRASVLVLIVSNKLLALAFNCGCASLPDSGASPSCCSMAAFDFFCFYALVLLAFL